MDELFSQILASSSSGVYYLALIGSLIIPDVCAGLESIDGLTTGKRYKEWFDKWVAFKYLVGNNGEPSFSGEDAYYFRCSMLHQGITQYSKSNYSRLIFVQPEAAKNFYLHNNRLDDALNLDIPTFCKDVVDSAFSWRTAVEHTETYKRNIEKFVRVHPNGLPPYIVGMPVIS